MPREERERRRGELTARMPRGWADGVVLSGWRDPRGGGRPVRLFLRCLVGSAETGGGSNRRGTDRPFINRIVYYDVLSIL